MTDTVSLISARFADLRSQNRMAFMPFVTAGDPDLQTTCELIRELARRGVDLIEVGFPYSDPIADGPVIQASYTRALEHGIHVRDVFEAIRTIGTGDDAVPCPLVAMVSYAIIFRVGLEAFLAQAKEAGFAGLIVPDLPGDEAAEFFKAARTAGLDLIQLVAPTTLPDRAQRILKHGSGFVYCVSVAGTTGVRDGLPTTLRQQLEQLRSQTELPLAVGFGISKPEHIEPLRGAANGVIVGSAIVRQLEPLQQTDDDSRIEVIRAIGHFAAEMVAAAHRSEAPDTR